MHKIDYVIETLSPINFSEKSVDSIFYATKTYIPGSAIRGALANKYINVKGLSSNAHENDGFYNLFLSGKVKYLPAYPIGNADENNAIPKILPPSIMKSKDGSEIKDLTNPETGKLGAGYKKVQGFIVSDIVEDKVKFYKVDTKVQIALHMGRNGDEERIQGRSKDGNIYNYEYIEEHQRFKGSILFENEEDVGKVSEIFDKMNFVYLGRAKNAQYGKCNLELLDNGKPKEIKEIEELEARDLYLYALTPYIPLEPFQNTSEAAKQLIKEVNAHFGENEEVLKLGKHMDGSSEFEESYFANKEEINGYVGVWNAKRETVNAISAGSLIKVTVKQDIDKKELNNLKEVVLKGIGDRVAEGYGQFRVWTPMENVTLNEFDEKCSKFEDDSQKAKALKAVKGKAFLIIKDRLLLEVRKKAKNDVVKNVKVNEYEKIGKHIIKRVEILMNAYDKKEEIKQKIKEFKDTAQKNLQKVTIEITTNDNEKNSVNLYDLLIEKINTHYYVNSFDKETIVKFKRDFGNNVSYCTEDEMYRTYWLWFARHFVKRDKPQETMMNPVLKNAEELGANYDA